MGWVFDWHGQDSRATGPLDVACTVTQTYENGTEPVATHQNQAVFAPRAFSFDSLASNSMKSANPYSGCREVDTAKTLDCGTPDPNRNQGGIAIVQKGSADEQ